MAYYSSNCYEGDTGEYNQSPYYTNNYDIVPFQDSTFQDSVSYPIYQFSEPNMFAYHSTAYGDAYVPYQTQSEINYSTYTITEPKLIEYNPIPLDPFPIQSEINYSTYTVTEPKLIEYNPFGHGTNNYFPSQTQYMISYSETSGLDDTEFIDPKPYGGGYDIDLTYGRPLAPSDEICYPLSLPEPNGPSPDNFSYGSIASPYGKDEIDDKSTEEEQQPSEKPLDLSQGEPREGYSCDGYYPWFGYDYGVRNEDCGPRYGYGGKVPQIPYGYGLESMDLCDCIFGYWPCLCRNNRNNYGHDQEVCSEEKRQENQWKVAADYLFGGPYTHGGDVVYNYERHYQEQHYKYVEREWN